MAATLIAAATLQSTTRTLAHFAHTGVQPLPRQMVADAHLVNNPQSTRDFVRLLCANSRQQGAKRGKAVAGKSPP